MKDFNYSQTALNQKASGAVDVLNYSGLLGVKASGIIYVQDYSELIGIASNGTATIADYNELIGLQAEGTIEVTDYSAFIGNQAEATIEIVDYSLFAAQKATGTITITDYSLLSGAVVTVDGNQLVEGVDWNMGATNEGAAGSLLTAINNLVNVDASGPAATITVEAAVAGVAGNSIGISGNATALLGMTFSGATLSGGSDVGGITLDETTFVWGVDFSGVTNEGAASSLAAALDAIDGVSASALGALVTIVDDVVGTESNGAEFIVTPVTAGTSTPFAGGTDHGSVTIQTALLPQVLTQGTDFTAETSNEVTATNIAAAIDALNGVSASAVGALVTITADAVGEAGNAYQFSINPVIGAGTVSGATLSGGHENGTVDINGTVLVQGVDFTAETSNEVTATNLAAAIDGVTGINATADGAVVTVVSATTGVAGDSITMSETPTAGITFSGATLSGGKDEAIVSVDGNQLVQGVDFTAETSNAVTATNLAAAIDAILSVTATADGDNVNVEAAATGEAGNDIAMVLVITSGASLSDGNLAGGVDDGNLVFGETTLVHGTNFTAETDESTTATNLAAAINAISGFSASAVDATITITADAEGDAGNVVMSSNKEGVFTFTQMSGGADATYSDSFDYDSEDNASIEIELDVDAIDEATTLRVIIEVSSTKDDWDEAFEFDTMSAVGRKTKILSECKNFARAKVLVAGGTATFKIHMQTSNSTGENEQVKTQINGRKVISITDTAIKLSDVSVNFRWLDVQALATNSNNISIGGASVDADAGEESGAILIPGASRRFENGNLKDIFINGTATEGVSWVGEQT